MDTKNNWFDNVCKQTDIQVLTETHVIHCAQFMCSNTTHFPIDLSLLLLYLWVSVEHIKYNIDIPAHTLASKYITNSSVNTSSSSSADVCFVYLFACSSSMVSVVAFSALLCCLFIACVFFLFSRLLSFFIKCLYILKGVRPASVSTKCRFCSQPMSQLNVTSPFQYPHIYTASNALCMYLIKISISPPCIGNQISL